MKFLIFVLLSFSHLPLQAAPTSKLDIEGYQRSILNLDIQGLGKQAVYYASDKTGPKPLFIYLHGAGWMRKDITKSTSPIAKGFMEFGYTCDVLLPHSKSMWKAKSLDQLISKIVKTNDIDTTKIYIGGFSMGGAGTWVHGFEGEQAIAAYVPMGSGASKTAKVHDKWDLKDMKDKPIWMFHGEKDKVVPYENAAETAQLMKELNPHFKFTTFEGVAHTPGGVYKMKSFYEWLFKQSL